MIRIILVVFASACLFLSGCSRYVLKAPAGCINVPCSFDQMSNAVGATASRAGAKDLKEKTYGHSDGIRQGQYSYATSGGTIVKIIYFQKEGKTAYLNVSLNRDSKGLLSDITEDLFNNLMKGL